MRTRTHRDVHFGWRIISPAQRLRWQYNPLVGAKVSRQIEWLIAQLAKINSTKRSTKVIVKLAFDIRGRLLDLRTSAAGAYRLHGDTKNGFRLAPKSADRGLANELGRLEHAARSGSKARWIKAWAAVSHSCRASVWRPALPPIVERHFDDAGRLIGFARAQFQQKMVGIDGVLLAPRVDAALPAILTARRNLAARPQDDRRGNKRNAEADALAAVIRSAVFQLTGRVGFTRNPETDALSGPLVDLGAAIDARFGTRIGWRVISTK